MVKKTSLFGKNEYIDYFCFYEKYIYIYNNVYDAAYSTDNSSTKY